MKKLNKVFTIGFTKKTAEQFFKILNEQDIDLLIDIRLNNSSQLAGFSKYPDIEFFLNKICNIEYKHDEKFSPSESTLSRYKKKEINWTSYEVEFEETMNLRQIEKYISENYEIYNSVCLLCSEPTAEFCHRRLIADKFKKVFKNIEIVNL